MVEKILEILEMESKEFIIKNELFSEKFYSDELKVKIKSQIEILNTVFKWGDVSDGYNKNYTAAERQHRAKTPVTITESRTLKRNATTWLTDKRINDIGWDSENISTYRDRYFKYLEKIGRSDKLINETRRSTLSIVKNFGDPNAGEGFYVKGMVVGSVQSGKTSNFNGVINTAIDSGYRMIIVLSGLMEDLRVQTQKRIEKDVIGTLGAGGQGIGVGAKYPFPDKTLTSVTSEESDFKRGLLKANFNIFHQHNILICKKNVSILRNILLWLNEFVSEKYPLIDLPLLIIDDEADNASLNNLGHKGREYATRTNKEIRSILSLFSKKSYLGYTATPFANVLQDRNESSDNHNSFTYNGNEYNFSMVDNLFPDDFIELLYPPSNYIGIKHFFDTKSDKINKIESLIARPIDIDDSNYFNQIPPRFIRNGDVPTTSREKGTRSASKNDIYPNTIDGLPNSLKEAVKCFIISIAIRLSRSSELINSPFYQKHHTMLVHISLFGTWQNRLADMLNEYLTELQEDLLNDALDQPVWSEFERIWNKHYFYIINNIQNHLSDDFSDPYLIAKDFASDIKPLLSAAVQGIDVMSINSFTGHNLIYPDDTPKKYIAVGGNRLSRGFTLEGLTINYFLRKANSADTLMQMGRWFGYRPGYLDCCKLFTTSDNINKFNEASLIMEDLEDKFEYLSKLPNRTPRDYTLWIRNNPDVIKLTRPNFLKGLTVRNLNFSDTVEQSTQFEINREKIIRSLDAFKGHVQKIDWDSEKCSGFLIYDTDQKGLMEFISLPNTMLNLNTLGLGSYLEECNSKNKLQKWRIAIKLITKGGGDLLPMDKSGLPVPIKMIKRSGPVIGPDTENPTNAFISLENNNIFKARNSTIISPSDFSITLTEKEKKQAVEDFRNDYGKKDVSVPDRAYRAKMDQTTGILIIYLMDLQKVFNVNDEASRNRLLVYARKKEVDDLINTPLIGYALGFPTVTGVDGDVFVSQHVFKEPADMTIDELHNYISERDFDLDMDNRIWTREELLAEIMEYEDNIEGDEIPFDLL